MRIAIVVALANNGVIGRGQQLPWHLPDDLKHFKALTVGKTVLMGRRTFESIGRALPGRRNLVLSHSRHEPSALTPTAPMAPIAPLASIALTADLGRATSVAYVASVEAALADAAAVAELCVIGGADVFRQTLPLATHLHLTRVRASIDGDVVFPDFDLQAWEETGRSEHPADPRHAWPMTFMDYRRR